MILVVQCGLSTCAQVTAAIGVFRVAFDFDQPVVFDKTDDAADGAAQLAHARHFFDVFVFVAIGPTAAVIGSGQVAHARHVAAIRFAFYLIPFVQVQTLSGLVLVWFCSGRFVVGKSVFGFVRTTKNTAGTDKGTKLHEPTTGVGSVFVAHLDASFQL